MSVDPHSEAVGQRIKARRQELGLDQASLAQRLGVHPATVSRAESRGLQRRRQIARFAQALDVDPSYLTAPSTTDPRLEAARTRLTSAAELLDEARKILEATP